jgi:hypothetical protein
VVSKVLAATKTEGRIVESGAYALLQLAALAVHCWNAHVLYVAADSSERNLRLRHALAFFAASVTAKAALWESRFDTEIPVFRYTK